MTQIPPEESTLRIAPGDPAAAAMQADGLCHTILLERPEEAPLRFPLGPAPLSIGRVPGNTIVLADAAVSRRHCVVELADGQARLTDAGSTNGTFVDGARIAAPILLADGARLRIGGHALRYECRRRSEIEAALSLTRDLERARGYVAALLPPPLVEGEVRTRWCFRPCATLGGDAFGYQRVGAEWFAAYMLDVAGHGVGAAMLSVSVMNVLRQRALPAVALSEPDAVLGALNDMFDMDRHDGLFFTLWYGAYHLPSRRLRYAAAGHHAAFLCVDEAAPLALATRNPVMGMQPGRSFTGAEIAVPPRSRLLLFSDGAFEVAATQGRRWGMEALVERLRCGPAMEAVYREVRELSGLDALEDDFSLLELVFA
jgi:hypothetical protein